MRPVRKTRRRFLFESTGLLLGGAALAARARAGDEGSDNDKHQDNDEESAVRVAVVGTGARGSDLIRKLTTIDSARIVAVCDDYPPHLEQGAKYAGPGVATFASYEEMLDEARPEAVLIATPLHLHYPMSLQAIERGCDVFCEKTMCYSIEEARDLRDRVRKAGVVFQVGLQRRANAIYRQAKAMVETGMLGRITAVKCQWHRNGNWRRPVPVPRGDERFAELEKRLNWRLYRATSRGLMTELASHQLDVVNWFLGRPPERVTATGGIDWWRDGREVHDNVFCTYEYELPWRDGPASSKPDAGDRPYTVRVTYSSLQNNAFEGASELVMGTEGTLLLTQRKGLFYREASVEDPGWDREGRVDRDAAVVTSGKTLRMKNDPWAHRGKPYEIDTESDDTRAELVSFLAAVRRRDPGTICDAHAGLVDAATVLIGDRALVEGGVVELPKGLAS